MAQFGGRYTYDFKSPQIRQLATQFLPAWGSGGAVSGQGGYWDFGQDNKPIYKQYLQDGTYHNVPFAGGGEGAAPWAQDVNSFVGKAIENGALSPQQFVDVFNKQSGNANAALNPDGTISYDAYSYDDEGGFLSKFMESELAPVAMFGGLMGGIGGFSDLFSGFGGGSGAGAAGGAMDMGVGGIGEAMGLGDVPWGVNPGGGVDYLSNIGDVFNYTPEFPLGDLSFPTNISVPGVDLTNIFPMTGVNAATAFASTGFPALDFGTTNSSFFDTIKELVGKVPVSTLTKLLTGSGTSGFSALGAGLGGLLGSLNGSKQAGTTTTVEDIPEWQKALLIPALSQASGLLSQQTKQTNPLIPPAQSQLESTIKGDYLNSNPYLDKAFNMGADQIKERLSPQFGHMQAFGDNSGWQQAYGRSLGDLATNVYGGNYQNERQRQLTASAQAPNFTSEASSASWSPFKNFMSVAGRGFGGTQSQPYFTNPFGGAMSGALLGGKLFG